MLWYGAFTFGISVFFNVALYVFCAYCLYTIGRRNGVKNSWLAFVPILQYYIIGSICEEYEISGVRIRHLEWAMCGLHFLQITLPYVRFFSPISYFAISVIVFATNILTALIMHKFAFLFEPRRAFIYAFLSLLGNIPMAIVLFLLKDKPMQMSAGAYPYPFAKR